MPVQPNGQAPYAPPSAVIEIVERYRDKGMESPFTVDVLLRAGITEAIAPRVLKALKLIDLLDHAGEPTPAFDELAKAPSDEYKDRLAAVIRAAYENVFLYADPGNTEGVRNAFRHYEPRGQLDRMVTLFTGLCHYAGIIEGNGKAPAPRQRRTATKPATPDGAKATRATKAKVTKQTPPPPPPPPRTDGIDGLKQKYIEALVERVTKDGVTDTDLLTRVEWLLGFREAPPEGDPKAPTKEASGG